MMLLPKIIEMQQASRVYEMERLLESEGPKGDFEGSVTGYWVRLQEDGTGLVSYRGKEYATKMLGSTSLKPGAEVELTYAKSIYYSKW